MEQRLSHRRRSDSLLEDVVDDEGEEDEWNKNGGGAAVVEYDLTWLAWEGGRVLKTVFIPPQSQVQVEEPRTRRP